MSTPELVKDQSELEALADLMSEEVRGLDEPVVSRFTIVHLDSNQFIGGKKLSVVGMTSNINLERMTSEIYSEINDIDLTTHNLGQATIARDLEPNRFTFQSKGKELPQDSNVFVYPIPTGIGMYDKEFMDFTKEHPDTYITIALSVEQKIIVNSSGGIAIQSIPFFQITCDHGYQPIPLRRTVTAF